MRAALVFLMVVVGCAADREAPGSDPGPGPDAGKADGWDPQAPCAAPALYVAPSGSNSASGSKTAPLKTIQAALDRAQPGVTVCVSGGTYRERLTVKRSGASGAFVTLRPAPGEHVRLFGEGARGANGDHMIFLGGVAYVRVVGLEIRGAGRVDDASGVRIEGAGHHLEIRDNEIHEMRGESAMGITVYGTDGAGVHDLVIDRNVIHDCEPAHSEALVVNGNVRAFRITRNTVRDVNNIGIDVIGGESVSSEFPDDGVVADNLVERANSAYDGSAAGIYSDGASNLVIERNIVTGCDFGIEIGAENPGVVTTNVIVRNNFLYRNFKAGLIFGGYDADRGRVRGVAFVHNTLSANARPNERTPHGYQGGAEGEIIVQWANDCVIANNILVGIEDAGAFVAFGGEASGIAITNNLYWNPGTLVARPSDARAVVADPLLADPGAGDFHLRAGSPAIDAASARADCGEMDLDKGPRVGGAAADLGADER
jgi:hypothetical protein